jgi:hypothetical protein
MANGSSSERDSVFRSPALWGGCGCCIGCLLIPIVLVTLAGGGAFWAVRQSGVQQEVLERVRSSSTLIERLGEPIDAGWLVEGSINVSPGTGEADYSVPLTGPAGSGRVFVSAQRRGGDWHFEELYVVIDGTEERIDLLAENGGTDAVAPAVSGSTEEKIVEMHRTAPGLPSAWPRAA